MRLRQLNIFSVFALLLASVSLLAVTWWGLQRLRANAMEVQHYYSVRELVGGELRANIEEYLHSGDAERLMASQSALQRLEVEARTLPSAVGEPVERLAEQLQLRLDGELRAAGKLAGNPEALLIQAESELRDTLASLAGAASQAANKSVAADYLRLTGALSRAVHTLTAARERLGLQGGEALVANIRFQLKQSSELLAQLNQLPPMGVLEERNANAFASMLWGKKADPTPAVDRSDSLREQLGYILGRYPGALEKTQTQVKAITVAQAAVRDGIGQMLAALADAEAGFLERQQAIRFQVQAALLSLVLAVATIGGVLYGAQHHLGKTLLQLAAHLRHLADGRLGKELALRSPLAEVGALRDSAGCLQRELETLVSQLQKRSAEVTAAGELVLGSSESLDQSCLEQMRQTTQASAAISEMAAASERVACAAEGVQRTADAASELIVQNTAAIDDTVQSIEALTGQIAHTGAALVQLQGDAARVQAFVSEIHVIANRTNLLALNAAIEAARAGPQGRGFAVVADEVRQLAVRSSGASQQIGELLERITRSSRELAVASARQESGSGASAETARVASAAQSRLVQHVSDIRAAVAQIASQAQGQFQAASEIAEFVQTVVVSTEEAGRNATESVRLSRRLHATGQQVASLADRFTLS